MGIVPANRESCMTIREIVEEGLHYAGTCRSLWLFGFFVGMASGGSNGGGGGGGDGGGAGAAAGVAAVGLEAVSGSGFTLIVAGILSVIVAGFIMRFIGEGALIEGVVRVRRGGTVTTRDGFRAGWAHWGVLLRIALLYLAASVASVGLLVGVCVVALKALGPLAAVLVGIPAAVVGIPWLVTLHLVQAFASRIAVLENRHALDAIGMARLFLHGRIVHGLRLMVATFVGTLLIMLLGFIVLVPVVLLLAALAAVLGIFPVVVLGALVLLPVSYVLAATMGTFRSSVWTIGYVTQVEP
jgi:hypothetical protein